MEQNYFTKSRKSTSVGTSTHWKNVTEDKNNGIFANDSLNSEKMRDYESTAHFCAYLALQHQNTDLMGNCRQWETL
jgi:hypothetical protein